MTLPTRSKLKEHSNIPLSSGFVAKCWCVFGEEAQSGISQMRQPAEGTRLNSLCHAAPPQGDYRSDVGFAGACCPKTFMRSVYEWTGSRFNLIEAKRLDNSHSGASPILGERKQN